MYGWRCAAEVASGFWLRITNRSSGPPSASAELHVRRHRQRKVATPAPKNYGAHRAGVTAPDLSLQERALTAIASHPLSIEARALPFCEPVVMLESPIWVDGFRISPERKAAIKVSLEGLEHFVFVSLWTSEKKPQPLSGGGKTFDFFLHPDSLEVLHVTTGTWRS